MSECHRTKSLLKGIMIVFKTKRSANSLHSSPEFWAVSIQIEQQKNMLVDKISRKTEINSKKKVRKYVAFLKEVRTGSM